MKVSIITVCYNNAATILSTLDSVFQQDYDDVEHVIIDGASEDGTLNIIDEYKLKNKVIVSEPDSGIYDAMNKGISLASGDVVGTLNADDFYISEDVISSVAKVFEDPKVEACFADLVYVDRVDTSQVVRYWQSQTYTEGLFKQGWMPAHPTFFVRRRVYEQYGCFNLSYEIAADFELLFRLIEKHKVRTVYLPKVLINMRLGGTTNKSFRNVFIQNKEIIHTLSKYYPDFSLVKFVFAKLVNRALQFIKQP